MSTQLDIEQATDVAMRAARAGAAAALRHFEAGVQVERKPDRSPVTIADRDSEDAILGVIRETFPDHDILAEESGAHGRGGPFRWIVDPLDGTRGFTRGGPFWGPLVALEHQGEIVAGAMALPVLGQTFWAGRGLGAWRDGRRLAVSGVSDWAEATLSLGEMRGLLASPQAEGVLELVRQAASTRCYGDLAGFALVLEGQADAWLEGGVQIWDLAPARILIEEAGGTFTDLAGRPTVATGSAVATNGLLHAYVLGQTGRNA